MRRALVVGACVLMSCKTLPKIPQDLEGWFALAREGKGLVERGQELEKRKASCDEIARAEVAWDEERAIGGASAIRWVQEQGGLVVTAPAGARTDALADLDGAQLTDEGAKLTRYVNTVGKNLAAQSSRPALPWVFGVLKSEQPNAYAAPGGIVLVTKGLLTLTENEAQLAGVLAHEVAHVTGRHAIHEYRARKVKECSTSFIKALGDETGLSTMMRERVEGTAKTFEGLLKKNAGAFIDFGEQGVNTNALVTLADGVADTLLSTAFSRETELEADAEAARLMANAGYDATEYQKVLSKLPRGGGPIGKHPPPEERKSFVGDALKKLNAEKLAPSAAGAKPPLLRR